MLENRGSRLGVGPPSDASDWSHPAATRHVIPIATLSIEICNLIDVKLYKAVRMNSHCRSCRIESHYEIHARFPPTGTRRLVGLSAKRIGDGELENTNTL